MTGDGREQADFDNRFAQIIEGLEQELQGPDGDDDGDDEGRRPPPGKPHGSNPSTSWGADEARHDDHDEAPSTDEQADPLEQLPSSWRMPTDGMSYLDDDEDDFVPPEPDPLPRDDLGFWAILTTLIGGPLWVLYLAIFAPYARTLWWVLAVCTCVAGVVLLVLRQPHSDDLEDDDDIDGPP